MTAREGGWAVGTFALVGALGFDSGGYAPTSWGWSALAVLVVAAALVARGSPSPTLPGVLLVAGLALFASWCAISLAWTSHTAGTVLEVERLVLYAAAAAVFVLAPSGRALLAGVLGAVTLLCGFGLVKWLLGTPEVPLSADPQAAFRLAEPIGYANGLAILAVLGLLLALGVAARSPDAWAQGTAAATAPLLAATLYLTLSRGAWVALAAGLAAAVAVGPGRLQLAAVAAGLAFPAGLAVGTAAAWEEGARPAAAIAVLCFASGAAGLGLRRARVTVSPGVRRAFAVVLAAVPVVVVAAALVRLGGPGGAYDAFTAAPAPVHGDASERVLSVSGSSRADYWRVALDVWRDEPLLGAGAGTYARAWVAERPIPQPVRDAHSLYLEVLAELGPLGLALLLVALGAPFAARRGEWTPVALGPYAAFLVHALQDWDWELPSVTVAAVACAGALVGPPRGRQLPRIGALAPAALCFLVVPAYLGNRALAEASAASDRGTYAEAVDAARSAERLQPWAGEPWRALGEAQLASGEVDAARASFRRGLDVDSRDWELWLDLGLASEGAEQERAWRRAESLNPLSPELQELREAGR